MERYDFKHGRMGVAILIFFPSVFLMMQTTGIGSAWHTLFIAIGGDSTYLIASVILFFVILTLSIIVPFNARGYAIFHKSHIEINLGFGTKTRELEYSKIRGIDKVFNTNGFHWRIEVEGERNMLITVGLRQKDLKLFIEEIKRKSPRLRTLK